ncbi:MULTISPECIES: phosphoribosylanthranilate isomerase [unclassified Psychrobacter]|uniref:phosphoribosylanthranilate isomerase n=1 Tax=unclassified Psychrobacter TaxID=196806 RepID=UPI0025B479AD|nr:MULTISPECIES: phosphoribosylanthranilate isomerase [unclassified Psychrobacter]MDN3452245.1 phosphoribosylanthranilate isomerase [Psychrobacter sp. APC 3350]MDN3502138.1 phosphoribosylanthranilate isomerase [Psychrobacter sp. 5A.1]
MHVKFCGFTQLSDIQTATQLGVDAVGLVFYPPSPRAVTLAQAQVLSTALPAFVSVVALVVNMPQDELVELADTVPFDIIQFHGDESPEQCQQLASTVNKRWIKALRVNADTDSAASVHAQIDEFAQAGASSILLDAYHQHKYGGTGARFDWSLIPQDSSLPIILAGGLDAENIAATLELPIYAVDVSGGIEVDKGKKDPAKMRAFMKAVKRDRWQNATPSEPSNTSS